MPTRIDPAEYAAQYRAENPNQAHRCCSPRWTAIIGMTDEAGNSLRAYDTTKLCDYPLGHGGNIHTYRRAFEAPIEWPV